MDKGKPGGKATSDSSGSAAPPAFQVVHTPEQARQYDFASHRLHQHETTVIESIGHLIKGCLGGGIVAMHESYKGCGLLSALFLNIMLGMFLSYCIYILVKSAQKMYGRMGVPVMSYPDVAEGALIMSPWKPLRKYHRIGRYAVDVTIGIDLFGSCAVYMVVISRTLKQLVLQTNESNDEGIRYYILGIMVPCILITWILQLKFLAPFSIVADVFIVCVVMATIVYGAKSATTSPFDTSVFPIVNGVTDVFTFMGAAVFSMEGVGVSMAIENHMKEPKKFPIVLVGAMSIVIIMVCLTGFFGFWGFGSNSKSPVTLNFEWNWVSIILKVFMFLMIYVTFGLNFWVPFDLCWYYLKKRHTEDTYWFWNRLYRSCFVISITILALIFPNVSSFIGLLGAFCLSNMGFIYPALIELVVNWDEGGAGKMYCRAIKCILICLFGTVLCIIGSITSIQALIEEVYGK